jgi:O-antigen ligase
VPDQAIRWLKWSYGYWIVSYLLTTAPIRNLISFDFLRRDGAILVAYLPLLLFGNLGLDSAFVKRALGTFLTVMALVATLGILEFADAVGVPLGLSWLPDQLQFVHYANLSEYALLISKPRANLISWETFWFAACFSGVALSKSRTAYIAFLGTFGLVFLTQRENYRKVMKIGILVLVPLAYLWLSQAEVSSRAAAVTDLEDPNVIGRMAHYAEAIQDISLSPLVGIGFGRFNDESKRYSGFPHFVYFATDGEIINDPSHAHNSYLHFLAEGGIAGLVLMMGVWFGVLGWVRRVQTRFIKGSFGYAFARGVQACIALEFLISFTEHSMGTAVTSLAVFSMVGMLRNLIADRSQATRTILVSDHVKEIVLKPTFRPA